MTVRSQYRAHQGAGIAAHILEDTEIECRKLSAGPRSPTGKLACLCAPLVLSSSDFASAVLVV